MIAISRCPDSSDKAICVCRQIPSGQTVYRFEYPVPASDAFKDAVVTCDGLHLVVVSVNAKSEEVLHVRQLTTGELAAKSRPKAADYRGFTRLVAMPRHPQRVALVDHDRGGHVWDWKKKTAVRWVPRWNGAISADGRYGLYAPSRGGLDLVDLKTGAVARILIPRVAEGVFGTLALFTANDRHVVYYHSGRRSIRVYRVDDGLQIADYQSQAEVTALASAGGGRSLALGAVSGSVVCLVVADPALEANVQFLGALPSRQLVRTGAGSGGSGVSGGHEPAAAAVVATSGGSVTCSTEAYTDVLRFVSKLKKK